MISIQSFIDFRRMAFESSCRFKLGNYEFLLDTNLFNSEKLMCCLVLGQYWTLLSFSKTKLNACKNST